MVNVLNGLCSYLLNFGARLLEALRQSSTLYPQGHLRSIFWWCIGHDLVLRVQGLGEPDGPCDEPWPLDLANAQPGQLAATSVTTELSV